MQLRYKWSSSLDGSGIARASPGEQAAHLENQIEEENIAKWRKSERK